MSPIRPMLLLLLVAACAETAVPVRLGGPPERRDAVRAVETTGRTGQRILGLTQGRIRACSGAYQPPTLLSPIRTTDLACTGGVRGTATVGPDLTGRRVVRWQLDTGERGQVAL